MKKKMTIVFCIFAVILATTLSIGFKQHPTTHTDYPLDRVAAIVAARAAGQQRIKDKDCVCCEYKVEKLKKAFEAIRKRNTVQE